MELRTSYIELQNVLTRIATSCGGADRPILSGVFAQRYKDDSNVFLATDGFTLAIQGDYKTSSELVGSAVVTVPNIKAVADSMKKDAKEALGAYNKGRWEHIEAEYDFEEIGGTFPYYVQLIPKNESVVDFDVEKLTMAVAILEKAAGFSSGVVRLEQVQSKNVTYLKASVHTEVVLGDLQVYVPAKIISEKTVRIAILYRYLKRLCKALDGNDKGVSLYWHSESSPICVTAPNFTYVFMPQYVQWD